MLFAIMAGGGAVNSKEASSGGFQSNCTVLSREVHRRQGLLTLDCTGRIWTSLRCCCTVEPLLLSSHFSFILTCWSQMWCSPSTLTPVRSSGKTENQGVCSDSLLPCTDNSTRIKECELTFVVLIVHVRPLLSRDV